MRNRIIHNIIHYLCPHRAVSAGWLLARAPSTDNDRDVPISLPAPPPQATRHTHAHYSLTLSPRREYSRSRTLVSTTTPTRTHTRRSRTHSQAYTPRTAPRRPVIECRNVVRLSSPLPLPPFQYTSSLSTSRIRRAFFSLSSHRERDRAVRVYVFTTVLARCTTTPIGS